MNQTERKPKQEQVPQASFGQLNDLARMVVSRTRGARTMLSPWVQRSLAAQTAPTDSPESEAGPRHWVALSEPYTRTLLSKVQRREAASRVWQPNVGSLEPGLVDRFAEAIVRRFPSTETKYQSQPLELAVTETPSLILPGEPAELVPEPESRPAQPYPTLADLERAIAAKSSWFQSRAEPGPTPPPVQRTPTEPPQSGPRPRFVPSPSQLFSKVEEISPGGKTRTRIRSPGTPAIQRDLTQLAETARSAPADDTAPVRKEQKPAELGAEPIVGPDHLEPGPESGEPTPQLDQARASLARPAETRPVRQPPTSVKSETPPVQRQLGKETSDQIKPPLPEVKEVEAALPEVAAPVPSEAEPPGRADREEIKAEVEPEPGPEPSRVAELPPSPTVQRQPEPEMPLRTEPSPPEVKEVEAGPPEKAAPSEAEPPGPPERPEIKAKVEPKPGPEPSRGSELPPSPTVQRQPEPEMPLRTEPPPPEVKKVEAGPPEKPTPSPGEAEPAGPPERPEIKAEVKPEPGPEPSRVSELPPSPTVQRQPEPEMPLRTKPSPPEVKEVEAGPPEKPAPAPSEAEPPGRADREEIKAEVEPEPSPEPSRVAELPPSPTVQRQPEPEMPLRTQPRPPGVKEVEAGPPEKPTPAPSEAEPAGPPERPEIKAEVESEPGPEPSRVAELPPSPTVQRQPEPEMPLRTQPRPPEMTSVETDLSKPEPPVPSISQTEPSSSLEAEILTRAARRTRLPLSKRLPSAGDPGRSKPIGQTKLPGVTQVQRQTHFEAGQATAGETDALGIARVQRQVSRDSLSRPWVRPRRTPISVRVGTVSSGVEPAATSVVSLPLQQLSQPSSMELVQRQPISPTEPQVISRLPEETAETPSTAEAAQPEQAQDLDQLARQVYPLIKQMLAVERERRLG